MHVITHDIIFLYDSTDYDTVIYLAAIYIIGFLLFILYQKYNYPSGSPEKPIPKKNVIDAINGFWRNEDFLEEMKLILYDEGNFDDLNKEIVEDHGLFYAANWLEINKRNYKLKTPQKNILTRILSTDHYKATIDKNKFSEIDMQFFDKLILLSLSWGEFPHFARAFIFKSIERNENMDVPQIDPWKLDGPTGPVS